MKIKKLVSLLTAAIMLASALTLTACSSSGAEVAEQLNNLEYLYAFDMQSIEDRPEVAEDIIVYSMYENQTHTITVFNDVESAKIWQKVLKKNNERDIEIQTAQLKMAKEYRKLAMKNKSSDWFYYDEEVTECQEKLDELKDMKVVRKGNVVYNGDSYFYEALEGKQKSDFWNDVKYLYRETVDEIEYDVVSLYFSMTTTSVTNSNLGRDEYEEYMLAAMNLYDMTGIYAAPASLYYENGALAKIAAKHYSKERDLIQDVYELRADYAENVLDRYEDELSDGRYDQLMKQATEDQDTEDWTYVQSGRLVLAGNWWDTMVGSIINIPFIRAALANM